MMYAVKRRDREIDRVLEKAEEAEAEGRTAWPGMTYEQGVAEGIRWMLGLTNDHPLEE